MKTIDFAIKNMSGKEAIDLKPFLFAQVSQLRHELSMKDELLQFYTSAAEESEPESICTTP